jgi:hypothetical protein
MEMVEKSDAYIMGQEAYARGDTTDKNPYDFFDAQFNEWEDGWFDLHWEDIEEE